MLDTVRIVIHDPRGHAVLVRRDLAYPAMRAQFDTGALCGRPIGDVGARLCSLCASRRAMAEIDAARAAFVIHSRDRGVGRPPMPAEPVHRLRQLSPGTAERQW